MDIREALRGKLTEEEMGLLRTSFDVIGDTCIMEVPEELEKKEKVIAEAVLAVNRNISTVYSKLSEREGELRLRKLKLLAGEPHITEHREHGFMLRMDPAKTYYSPREGTERQRVAAQVKPGETVMVMFAGCGPFAIAIARAQKDVRKVLAVELNEDACDYMAWNFRANRLMGKAVSVCGDVREKCRFYYGECDRVVMPLPKGAHEFLDVALKCLKPSGGIVHMYHWSGEKDLFSGAEKSIKEACAKEGKMGRILEERQVLPYGPRIWKICVDFSVK